MFRPNQSPVIVHRGLFVLVFALMSNVVVAAERAPTMNMTIDQRLSRLERLQANENLVDLFNKIESLQNEIESVRGELEVVSHDVRNLKKQQKDIYSDLDKRIEQLNKQTANLANQVESIGSNASSGSSTASSVSSAPLTLAPIQEQEAYQNVFTLIKENKYQEAITQFQVFLINFPNGSFADNAQYWMAESYYVLKDYKAAAVEFGRVITRYPKSGKIPDAYLKLGFCYYELQDWNAARKNLEIVINQYADSSAAKLAQRRLDQLKVEGH